MPSRSGGSRDRSASEDGTALLESIRSADSLAELADVVGADSEHEAYFAAKAEWRDLRRDELERDSSGDGDSDGIAGGLPGDRIVVEGQPFVVHGITHADTDAERSFLREHVKTFLEESHTIYCEQGIRRMYFEDVPEVCGMDDYRWAMQRCRELGLDPELDDEFDGLSEDARELASRFRETAFSLIESGEGVYGESFARALGDVASEFLVDHGELATGADFEAFRRSREAATDPGKLADLQRYYACAFLPQPLEREWLRRHDRELEIVTHARNERMAAYALFHADSEPVHLIVGAAHQPGVSYYLEAHRDGRLSLSFEPVE